MQEAVEACEGEGRSEGVRDRAAGMMVFGVDLIARHYCGILLDAGRIGSQHIRATAQQSTAQHSKAESQQISAGRKEASESCPRVPSGWKLFSPACAMATHNCYRTPRMAAEVRICMYGHVAGTVASMVYPCAM